jgi:hypothetical protein
MRSEKLKTTPGAQIAKPTMCRSCAADRLESKSFIYA